MFSFFHRTSVINVDCFTSNVNAYKFAPIVAASDARPEWYDKVENMQQSNTPWPQYKVDEKTQEISFNPQNHSLRNVKSCLGFQNLYSKGFMLESWCDLAINSHENGLSHHYSNGSQPSMHSNGQVKPGFTNHHIMKLVSPWAIQTKEDIQFISIPAQWSLEKYNFHILPGVLDFHTQSACNVFVVIKKGVPDQFLLPMGQPLAQFVPLSDKKVKIHNHIVTDQELKTKTFGASGTSAGWRRTVSLMKRNDSREKKCPFGFGN